MMKLVMMNMITKCWFQNLIMSFKVKVLLQSTNAKRLSQNTNVKTWEWKGCWKVQTQRLQKDGSSWEESDEKVTQNQKP